MDSESTSGPCTASAPRRDFIKASPAAGLLIVSPSTACGSQANSTIELGLLGCGSRGNWIAPLFNEYAPTRWVAAADVIRQSLDDTAKAFDIPADRAYYGPDAYRELAASKLDAVVIETPPCSHPEHAQATLGRMAAYRNDFVTWDEMMRSTEKWEANLKLAW